MATIRRQRLTRIKHNRMRREIQTRVRSETTPWLDHTDRRGRVINLYRWSHLWGKWSYRCVASDVVGNFRVTTIWLGHGFESERFETAIKRQGEYQVVQSYATEAEALAWHMRYAYELGSIVLPVAKADAGELLSP